MSKSKGNVVIPDEYVKKYGVGTLRLYLMFLGPFDQGGDFRDTGVEGMHRFVKKVWRLVQEVLSIKYEVLSIKESKSLDKIMHETIKEVTEDLENLRYNTAIAHIMEYYNHLHDFYTKYKILNTKYCKSLLLLLAPFAPHMTEELWQKLHSARGPAAPHPRPTSSVANAPSGRSSGAPRSASPLRSIHLQPWPAYNPKYLEEEEVTVVIQVNGKRRGEIQVQSEKLKVQSEVERLARKEIEKYLAGKAVKNVIHVPGRIINFVM